MPFSYVLYGRGRNIAFQSQRYTFLLKLPKISGIFFQKEGKEEGYRGISHADFTDYADFDLLGLGFRKF